MKVIYDELYPEEFFNYGGIVKVGSFNFEIKNIVEWNESTSAPNWTSDYINTVNGGDACIGTMHFKFDDENDWFKYTGDLPKLEDKDAYGIQNVNFSLINPDHPKWDKFTKQRLERGFDDSEIWNLDLTIAKFILPRIEALKETFIGYPAFFNSEDEWKKILEKICRAFHLYINCDDDCIEDLKTIKWLHGNDNPNELEEILKEHEEYEEGMNLFFQYWKWLGD